MRAPGRGIDESNALYRGVIRIFYGQTELLPREIQLVLVFYKLLIGKNIRMRVLYLLKLV